MEKTSLVLILNKSFTPVNVTDYKRAIALIFSGRAKILDHKTYNLYSWEEWGNVELNYYKKIKTSSRCYQIPEIIILNHYDRYQKRIFKANKKNIFKRDKGICQYCHVTMNYLQSTIDHVNPKSKNGKLSWANCVLSCRKCNHKKANFSLEQAKMKLTKQPTVPDFSIIDVNSFLYFQINTPESWKIFQEQKT